MYNQEKWRRVWKIPVNKCGFTMIEALLSMMIMMFVVTILPFIFIFFFRLSDMFQTENLYEWNLFLIQIKREIYNSATLPNVKSNHLYLTEDGREILIEKYGAVVRRRVDGAGHETMLQNVKSIKFEIINHYLNVVVTFSSDKESKASWYLNEAT